MDLEMLQHGSFAYCGMASIAKGCHREEEVIFTLEGCQTLPLVRPCQTLAALAGCLQHVGCRTQAKHPVCLGGWKVGTDHEMGCSAIVFFWEIVLIHIGIGDVDRLSLMGLRVAAGSYVRQEQLRVHLLSNTQRWECESAHGGKSGVK